MLKVDRLDASIGPTRILRAIELEVPAGSMCGLIGRNGAGKTSTLRTIARTDNPQMRQGEIWLDGLPIHQMSSFQAARSGIQLVEDFRAGKVIRDECPRGKGQSFHPHRWVLEGKGDA